MARRERRVERVEFAADEQAPVLEAMATLAYAGDGWINLVARFTEDDDEVATALGFSTLFGGGSSGVTMCTWIPERHRRRGPSRSRLGIAHLAGRRVVAELRAKGIEVPPNWFVEQDHPRRGLVVRVPADAPPETVLAWALRVIVEVSAPRRITGWRADVHLPASS